MPIKDRDGNEFRLRGPGQLKKIPDPFPEPTIPVTTQKEEEPWDESKVQLINWNTTVISETPPQIIEIEEAPPQEITPEKKIVSPEQATELVNPYENLKTVFVGVPLLEDVQKEVVFNGFILSRTDLQLIFWANITLSIGSIVLPKDSTKKWWKITEIRPAQKGQVFSAIVSDVSKFW